MSSCRKSISSYMLENRFTNQCFGRTYSKACWGSLANKLLCELLSFLPAKFSLSQTPNLPLPSLQFFYAHCGSLHSIRAQFLQTGNGWGLRNSVPPWLAEGSNCLLWVGLCLQKEENRCRLCWVEWEMLFALDPQGRGFRDMQSHKTEPLIFLGVFFKNAFYSGTNK